MSSIPIIEDITKLICSYLDSKIITILNKKIRGEYFKKYYICLDLDNRIYNLSITCLNFIEKYGLYVKLSKLTYQINRGDISVSSLPIRSIAAEFLIDRVFDLFKHFIDKTYFLEHILTKVKLVHSRTVVVPEAFIVAFPNAKFIGPIDWISKNGEIIENSQKFNDCWSGLPLSQGIDYLVCDIYNGTLYPSKISCDYINIIKDNTDYIREILVGHDNMDILLKPDLILPSLRCLNFGYGFVDYKFLERILLKYPNITNIKNFKIFTFAHLEVYEKFYRLIDKIHIVSNPLSFWRHEDKNITEDLIIKLCEIEKCIGSISIGNKKIIFNEYIPSIEKIINISKWFRVKINLSYENMFTYLKILSDMGPRESIRPCVVNIHTVTNNAIEVAKKVIKIYNLMEIYYDIDDLITNLDMNYREGKYYKDILLTIIKKIM